MTEQAHRYFSDVKWSEDDILLFMSLLKLGEKEALIGKLDDVFASKTEPYSQISVLTAKKYPISLAGNYDPVLFPEGSLGHLSGLDALVQGLESSSNVNLGLSYGEFPYGTRSIGHLNEILGDFKGYLVTGPRVTCSNLRIKGQYEAKDEFGTISINSLADFHLIAEAFNAFWVLVDGEIIKIEKWFDDFKPEGALLTSLQLILVSFSVPLSESHIKQLDLLRRRFELSGLTFPLSLLDCHRSLVKEVGYFHEGWFIDKPPKDSLGTSIDKIAKASSKKKSYYPTLGGRSVFCIPIMTVNEATKWIKELFPESSQGRFLNSIYPALKNHSLSSSFEILSWTERLLWSFAVIDALQVEASNIFLPFCSDYLPHLVRKVPKLFRQVSRSNRLVKLESQPKELIKSCEIGVKGGLNCSGFRLKNESSLTLVMPAFSSVWVVALVGPPFSGKTLMAKALARESNFEQGILNWQEEIRRSSESSRPGKSSRSGRGSRYAPLSISGRYLSYWPDDDADAVRDQTIGAWSGLENALATIKIYDSTLYEKLLSKRFSLWESVTLAQSFIELDPILRIFFRALLGRDSLDDTCADILSLQEDVLNARNITLSCKLITADPVLQRLAIIARALPSRLHLWGSNRSSAKNTKVTFSSSRLVRKQIKQIKRIQSFLVCDHFLSDLSTKQQERLIFALAGLPEYGIAVIYTSWRSVINITGQLTVDFGR